MMMNMMMIEFVNDSGILAKTFGVKDTGGNQLYAFSAVIKCCLYKIKCVQ